MRIFPAKKIVMTAVCAALCVVLPMVFHSFPNGGSVFLPMHIPVLLCGFICGWPYGLLCGLVGPALSSLITSMPPAATLPAMMIECAVYGSVSGFMLSKLRTGKDYWDLYISLMTAMLLGRIVSGIAKALIFAPSTTLSAWAVASFVTALPGILIQLVLLPSLVLALTKARLIPERYPKGAEHEETGCD